MANDWENTFRNWGSSPSATEQTRCNNALGVIRRAISQSPDLNSRNTNTFAQGSYRNHTNVRADSDVDIQEIPKDSFSLAIGKGGEVLLSVTGVAETKVNQKIVADDSKVALHSGDEIESSGAKFIYRSEDGVSRRLAIPVISVFLILEALLLFITILSVLALY